MKNQKGKWLRRDVWHLYAHDEDHAPGVYVIFVGLSPVYVGTSERLRARLGTYRMVNYAQGFTRTPWGDFPFDTHKVTFRVKYAKRFGENLMLEARLIRRLQPQFNIRGRA